MSCYKQALSWNDDFLHFEYDATGTGNCTPPNCSFYLFTATVPQGVYRGPVTIEGTTPPGSEFGGPVVTSSSDSCPPAQWQCDGPRGGNNRFTCRIDDCLVAADDRITVRLDGSVAPDLSEPPDRPLEKTACSTIEWQPRSQPGDIEQVASAQRESACFTTTVLAKPKPEPLDLAISKTTIGDCNGTDSCRFQLAVRSTTGREYDGKIAIRDTLPAPGATLKQVSGPASCSLAGQQVNCIAEPGGLAGGKELFLTLDIGLPRAGGDRQYQNCAEIYLPDAADGSKLSRDEVRMVQRALDHMGFDPGPVDGIVGSRTRSAAAKAGDALGLAGEVAIDRALLSALLGQPGGVTDINSANNRACARVELPPCGPGYSVSRTTGQCICPAPRVERNGSCVLVKKQEPEVQQVRPQQQAPQVKKQTPPSQTQSQPEPIQCIGGVNLAGICVCPPGHMPERLASGGGFRCVQIPVRKTTPEPETRQPQPVNPLLPKLIPKLEMIPVQPTDECPPGQVYSHQAGRCIDKPIQ
jgi:peptidoglycan hydrolase-like protein with peptidoglycan-binding domain